MKLFFFVSFLLLFALAASAQQSQIEKDFEKNKSKYSVEHFSMGEDATSGYDYLFYKAGDKIIRIRMIWSASYSKELRVDDYYFDGELVFKRRQTSSKRLLKTLKSGRNAALTPKEEFHFVSGRLTKWIKDGVAIPSTDPKWIEMEKGVLDEANGERENYVWLKKEN